MPFKMVTLSEREVSRIAGNAGTHAERMAVALTNRWRKYLPKGQKVIDVQQLQLCVRDDLRRLRVEIRDIEKDHLTQLETNRLGREVRDVAVPQLRGRLLGIQRLFDGTFGAGSSTKVFGEDTVVVPTDPFELLRVANIAHGRLMDPALVLPEGQLEGVKITPRSLAKGFEPPLATLNQALEGLEKTLPATHASLEQKIRTLSDLRQQAGIAARFLEALYYLAGHDEIAQRVRLSSHRDRTTVRVAEPEGTDTDGGEIEGSPEAPAEPVVAAAVAEQVSEQDAVRAAA